MLFRGPFELLLEPEEDEPELPSLRAPFSDIEVFPLPKRLILRSFESSRCDVPVESFVIVTDPGAAEGRPSPSFGFLIGEIVTLPSILWDDMDEEDEEEELLDDELEDFRSSLRDHLLLWSPPEELLSLYELDDEDFDEEDEEDLEGSSLGFLGAGSSLERFMLVGESLFSPLPGVGLEVPLSLLISKSLTEQSFRFFFSPLFSFDDAEEELDPLEGGLVDEEEEELEPF